MNLLMLILIFLALVVAGSIGYIAWEITSESSPTGKRKPDDAKESKTSSGSHDSPDNNQGA